MNEEQIRIIIREELSRFIKSDRFIFEKNLQLMDGRNIQLGITTGTKIGGSGQKIGFFGVTPVIRQVVGQPYTASDIGIALKTLGLLNT